MFKLLCVLNFIILVTSNPLQGATCPLATYQSNYVSEVPLSPNFNPYQQRNAIQYRLAPTIQTLPYSYNSQINGYYFDNSLTNTQTSSLANQDGRLNYYNPNTNKATKVVNNYIIVPPEYIKVNQGDANDVKSYNVNKNYKYVKENNHKEKAKCKREENDGVRNIYDTDFRNKVVDVKCNINNDNTVTKQIIRNEDDVSNRKQKCNNKTSKSSKRKKNLDVEENKEEPKIKKKSNKKSKKNKNKKSKTKDETKHISKDEETQERTMLRDNEKRDMKTADADVCFDINEDCACLENRKPRNNCYEPKNNYQQQFSRGFSENIASYLNNIMSNPQFSQHYLNSFGNIPYNFDYLYQFPQTYSQNSNKSNKLVKNRRKSSKCNRNSRINNNNKSRTTEKGTNKSQSQKEVSNNCKVVELEPLFIYIEDTKPNIQETKNSEVINKETVDQKELKTVEEDTLEAPQVIKDTDWVQLHVDDDSNEVYIAPISDDVPDTDPEVPEDYYPDFTSDKIYLSKEEYEYNFHDRHYYNSDNKAEMSIESRRYERIDGHSKHVNDVTDDVTRAHDKNNKQKKDHKNVHSSELEFRTPPPLLFPDFKTNMINKDSLTSRSRHHQAENIEDYDGRTHHYQDPFYDLKEPISRDLGHRNEVETVFAHSKVIKYGTTPRKEEISSIASDETRNDDKNLFSTDGKTTVIIAKSLGYPEEY